MRHRQGRGSRPTSGHTRTLARRSTSPVLHYEDIRLPRNDIREWRYSDQRSRVLWGRASHAISVTLLALPSSRKVVLVHSNRRVRGHFWAIRGALFDTLRLQPRLGDQLSYARWGIVNPARAPRNRYALLRRFNSHVERLRCR
ncbi:hypothetical protein OH77DRAFT_1243818 [Trametes cingulata]|nr:hypothetical protein OH77DRAFT_1243818 [Trametes cingulata]